MDQGERTTDREALATKGKRRRSGGCATKATVLIRGDLALPERVTQALRLFACLRSEKSAEAVLAEPALRGLGR